MIAEVKALACELPATFGLPLSRFSRAELRRHVLAAGIVAEVSGVTIWRWLHRDALRPWNRRSWIFPPDPDFAAKAGPVLDLYHRRCSGRVLADDEFVISADEKTQIPIRTRCHPITPPAGAGPSVSSTNIAVTESVPTSLHGTSIAPNSSAMSSTLAGSHYREPRPRSAGASLSRSPIFNSPALRGPGSSYRPKAPLPNSASSLPEASQ